MFKTEADFLVETTEKLTNPTRMSGDERHAQLSKLRSNYFRKKVLAERRRAKLRNTQEFPRRWFFAILQIRKSFITRFWITRRATAGWQISPWESEELQLINGGEKTISAFFIVWQKPRLKITKRTLIFCVFCFIPHLKDMIFPNYFLNNLSHDFTILLAIIFE